MKQKNEEVKEENITRQTVIKKKEQPDTYA